MPAYMQTITENFTTTMGIVIAFYFGASAYVQTHEKIRIDLILKIEEKNSLSI